MQKQLLGKLLYRFLLRLLQCPFFIYLLSPPLNEKVSLKNNPQKSVVKNLLLNCKAFKSRPLLHYLLPLRYYPNLTKKKKLPIASPQLDNVTFSMFLEFVYICYFRYISYYFYYIKFFTIKLYYILDFLLNISNLVESAPYDWVRTLLKPLYMWELKSSEIKNHIKQPLFRVETTGVRRSGSTGI